MAVAGNLPRNINISRNAAFICTRFSTHLFWFWRFKDLSILQFHHNFLPDGIISNHTFVVILNLKCGLFTVGHHLQFNTLPVHLSKGFLSFLLTL